MTSYFVITGYLVALTLVLLLAGVTTPVVLLVVAFIYLALNSHVIGTSLSIIQRYLANEKLLKLGLVLLFSSIMLWRVRLSGEFEASPVDTVAGFRMVQIAIALLIGIVKFRKGALNLAMFSVFTFVLIYSCFGVLSTLYSSAPMYTLYKATETLTDVIVVASILGCCRSLNEFMEFFVIAIGVFLFVEITIWLGILLAPQLALRPGKSLFGRQLRGVLPVLNPNKVGFVSAVLVLAAPFGFLVSGLRKDRIFYMTVLLASLPVFILAQSRTSLAGVFFALLVFLTLNKEIKWIGVMCVLAGLLLVWTEFGAVMVDYLRKGENPEMIGTLTGRTVAWEYAWEMFKKSPVLGYGFASGARFDVLGGSSMIGLHGSIFDVLVNLGLVGTIPWLLAIIGTWIQLLFVFFKYSKRMLSRVRLIHTYMLSMVVLLTLRAVTATALVMHDMEFVLFLLLMGYAQLAIRNKGFVDSRPVPTT